MEGILKVTPEKLTQTSGEFAATGNQMKNLTSEMIAQIHEMKGIWQGEAASGINLILCRLIWTNFTGWCRSM